MKKENKLAHKKFNLYYKPPKDSIFREVKNESIKIWKSYDDTYGYVTGKVKKIKDLENVSDNFMYMFAMFDVHNQRKLLSNLSDASRVAIRLRLPVEYNLLYLANL